MKKLQKQVTEYVDDFISYCNNEERTELIERLTTSLLDEVFYSLNTHLREVWE